MMRFPPYRERPKWRLHGASIHGEGCMEPSKEKPGNINNLRGENRVMILRGFIARNPPVVQRAVCVFRNPQKLRRVDWEKEGFVFLSD
jgi:hypothetical protein